MKITALNQGLKDKERVNVFIDNEFRIALDKNTIIQENIFVGEEVDNSLLQRLKDLDSYNLIARKLLNWALIRPRSSKEISDKVKKAVENRKSSSFNYKIDLVKLNEFVVNKLEGIGVNNKAFGIWWIENRKHQAKYGRQRIQSELLNKGLSSSLIKELINEYYPDDAIAAENILQKKYGVSSIKEIKDYNIRSKAFRLLASKGFKAR